jgi:hypothetical protein
MPPRHPERPGPAESRLRHGARGARADARVAAIAARPSLEPEHGGGAGDQHHAEQVRSRAVVDGLELIDDRGRQRVEADQHEQPVLRQQVQRDQHRSAYDRQP